MSVRALWDRWAGVPLRIRRGVVRPEKGLEVEERAELGDVGEVGEQREVEAELQDGEEHWEVPVTVSAVRDRWEGYRTASVEGLRSVETVLR